MAPNSGAPGKLDPLVQPFFCDPASFSNVLTLMPSFISSPDPPPQWRTLFSAQWASCLHYFQPWLRNLTLYCCCRLLRFSLLRTTWFWIFQIISETDLPLPTAADGHGAPAVVTASDFRLCRVWGEVLRNCSWEWIPSDFCLHGIWGEVLRNCWSGLGEFTVICLCVTFISYQTINSFLLLFSYFSVLLIIISSSFNIVIINPSPGCGPGNIQECLAWLHAQKYKYIWLNDLITR